MIKKASRGQSRMSSSDPIQGRPSHVLPRQVQSRGGARSPLHQGRAGQGREKVSTLAAAAIIHRG